MRTFLLIIFTIAITTASAQPAQKPVPPEKHMQGSGIALAVGGAVNMAVAATYLAINHSAKEQLAIGFSALALGAATFTVGIDLTTHANRYKKHQAKLTARISPTGAGLLLQF